MILYLGYWFPLARRARYIALFMAAVPIASAVGAPVSSLLLETHGFLGLAGWQWLFVLEGIPACLLGVAVLLWLPDGRKAAPWLSDEERAAIAARLDADHAIETSLARHALWPALTDARVIVLGLVYFGLVSALRHRAVAAADHAGDGLFDAADRPHPDHPLRPQRRRDARLGPPKRRPRRAHPPRRGAALLAAFGLVASVHTDSHALAIAAVTVAAIGIYGALGPFWAVPPLFLRGTAAAAGIALINSIGNLGVFVGPYLVAGSSRRRPLFGRLRGARHHRVRRRRARARARADAEGRRLGRPLRSGAALTPP